MTSLQNFQRIIVREKDSTARNKTTYEIKGLYPLQKPAPSRLGGKLVSEHNRPSRPRKTNDFTFLVEGIATGLVAGMPATEKVCFLEESQGQHILETALDQSNPQPSKFLNDEDISHTIASRLFHSPESQSREQKELNFQRLQNPIAQDEWQFPEGLKNMSFPVNLLLYREDAQNYKDNPPEFRRLCKERLEAEPSTPTP